MHAQMGKSSSVPRQTFEEHPFSLDAEVEQKYSFKKQAFLNPLKVGLSYRTPHGSYRIGMGYSFTPQTRESTVGLGLRFHILSFGERR